MKMKINRESNNHQYGQTVPPVPIVSLKNQRKQDEVYWRLNEHWYGMCGRIARQYQPSKTPNHLRKTQGLQK
jgi:hypothetical protein